MRICGEGLDPYLATDTPAGNWTPIEYFEQLPEQVKVLMDDGIWGELEDCEVMRSVVHASRQIELVSFIHFP